MSARRRQRREITKWSGPTRPYDLVKEFCYCLLGVALLTAACALIFSSPDEKPVSVAQWAQSDPHDFVLTAVSELGGTSGTAGYGPPYNSATDGQKIGPLSLPKITGVRIPIDTARDLVITPLRLVSAASPDLQQAIVAWEASTDAQKSQWTSTYATAADAATYDADGHPAGVTGDIGPVPVMMDALVTMARGGGLDGALSTEKGFYNNDYTKPMLFLSDGGFMESQATAQHLGGDQWGMMNEVGNYPGQAWLWLYTVWYQVRPFKTSGNADALIWGMMMVFTALFVLVPFIPGLRDIPKKVRVYRIIWRDHYGQRTSSETGPKLPR